MIAMATSTKYQDANFYLAGASDVPPFQAGNIS
jgi:hypothetical protein